MSLAVTPGPSKTYTSYKKDLVGIEFAGTYWAENTRHNQLGGPLGIAHDITPTKLEAAAVLDIGGFLSDAIVPAIAFDQYDVVGSMVAEGYAKDAKNDGYAESFFTDEVEVYLGLINENNPNTSADDEVVGAVEVEIDFKRKVDVLLNGGQNIDTLIDSLGTGALLSLVKDIDIKYYANTADPLVEGIAAFAVTVADLFADALAPLASLIEIEAGDPQPSKWAAATFDMLRTPVAS